MIKQKEVSLMEVYLTILIWMVVSVLAYSQGIITWLSILILYNIIFIISVIYSKSKIKKEMKK